jgi:hypothetical protein
MHKPAKEYFTEITICGMHLCLLTEHVHVHLITRKDKVLKYLLFLLAWKFKTDMVAL